MAFLQDVAINTLWYSSTPDEVPDAGDPSAFNKGTIAVNTNDGKMWVNITGGDVTGSWEAVGGGIANPLLVANGGTGVQTLTQDGVLIGNAADPVTAVDLSTAGSLLIGDGNGNPSALVKGANDTVLTTNGSGVVGWAAPAAGHAHSGSTDETFQDIYVRNIYDKDSAVSGTYLNKIELAHSRTNIYVSEYYNSAHRQEMAVEIGAYSVGTAPSQDAYGSMGLGGTVSASYSLKIYGTNPAGQAYNSTSWAVTSDERLKTSTASLTGATAKIKALNPVSYQWSAAYIEATGHSNRTNIGYLANEYVTVFPNDITTTTEDLIRLSDGSYATGEYTPKVASAQEALPAGATVSVADIKILNPDSVVPYLVAAFKELEARVIALEAE